MFNLQGSEIIFILLLALVVLGPEKLPGAIRRAMQTYAELRKLGTGFQAEFKAAIDEPMREMRETANLIKEQADPKQFTDEAERAAEAAAAADRADAALVAAGDRSDVERADAQGDDAPVEASPAADVVDPFDDPVGELDDVPVDELDDDPIDETPVDEAPVDEAPVDDATVDEGVDEAMEESA